MQTEKTFTRAREVAREMDMIGNRVVKMDSRVVSLSGFVGGRESNPIQWYGHAITYVSANGEHCIKFWPGVGEIRDAERSVYVVDGQPMYVAGWQGCGLMSATPADRHHDGYVLLYPMDSDMPMLPKRTYFFRTSSIPALNGEAY